MQKDLSGKECFMDTIQKLPFILGASAAIIVGIISIGQELSQQEAYVRMGISMIAFFILGSYARSTFLKIQAEVVQKKQELEELERRKAMDEQEAGDSDMAGAQKKHTVEFTVGSGDEDFLPYAVSHMLRTDNK